MIAKRVRITGRVQGVFFRAWTSEEADRLGLGGWVRNCADGSVEAHIEGDAQAVEQLVTKLHQGPPDARVEHVECDDAEPEGGDGFAVRG